MISGRYNNNHGTFSFHVESGLNGAIPTVYDANWQLYTDLTKEQIAAFQAMPEWQSFLDYVALSPTAATAGTPTAVVSAAISAARIL